MSSPGSCERQAGGSETEGRRCDHGSRSPSQRVGFEEAAVRLEDGGRGHKPRNHLDAAKDEMDSLWSLQRERSPADTLILASETDFRLLMF